ncbi:MAG: serine hydrolase [Sneathiella sp.]|mgnify:FL=1|jgi:CubicO group peptidase (beta-lactamase class C family)|uniref:serine hydrolase domain-containing protein n=1 Tax=Sneathiella sp. TaxID=1964365 RepID=UPI000C4AA667|nr:serine hydrolase domain-containing protein [Sneathiella sp.]MAL80539.1 serine hydrolase [Sneathiella sp.]
MLKPVQKPESLGFSPDRLQYITDWMQRYVDDGKLAGTQTVIARSGKIAYSKSIGLRDIDSASPWTDDTMARFYSMSKPVTSVALMMLYEKGLFHLDDPVDEFIPAFKDMQVLRPQARNIEDTEPAKVRMTVHNLLTHMSGMTYGFNLGVLGDYYEKEKMDFGPRRGTLEKEVNRLAAMPLLFEPGARWNYGVSTDVVGRLVEVISGQDLKSFFHENIFDPLRMTDTDFGVPEEKLGRYASAYMSDGKGGMALLDPARKSAFAEEKVSCYSGGGGLVSTAADYLKFAEMIRCRGAVEGGRLLGPRTVDFMTSNHLKGDLAANGQPVFSEVSFVGVGFGLGGWVMLEPALSQMMGSPGDFGWGGMASTVFWVDPVEDMTVLFLTQFVPSSFYPLRKELRTLVHQALID